MSTCKTGKINYSIHVYITKQNQSTRSCLRKFGKFTIPLFFSANTLYGNVENISCIRNVMILKQVKNCGFCKLDNPMI